MGWLLGGLLSAVFVHLSGVPGQLISARLPMGTEGFPGLAPGVDLTPLLAQALHNGLGMAPTTALLAASLSALPFLLVLVIRTTPSRLGPLAHGLRIAGHPMSWALMLSGYGWAALGWYGLWRLLADLPDRPPHQGMPLAGVGIGALALTVPHVLTFALPLAAVLWLVAPRHMLTRHMRVFYLLSFTPMAMILTAYAYADWLFDSTQPMTMDRPWAPPVLVMSLVLASVPHLSAGRPGHWDVRATIIVCAALGVTTGGPIVMGAAAILLGHEALTARFGSRSITAVSGYGLSLGIAFALAMAPHLGG